MVEAVIRFLIGVCLLVLCVVLVLWVLAVLGIAIPPKVVTIIYVIAALIAVLYLVRILRPHAGGWLP